jgi:dipeptidyl aminopeptidase/acylaminoacyl peptidase
MLTWLGRSLLVFLLVVCNGASAGLAASQRPIRIDDLRSIEDLQDFTFSPDGQGLAFTKRHSTISLPPQAQTGLVVRKGGDIWVQLHPGEPARSITDGQSDGSGWWSPQWSPDGQRLAFLSSRGGTVSLWGWDRMTGVVRQLSSHGIGEDRSSASCQWLDAQHLACFGPPEGEAEPAISRTGTALASAKAAWDKALRGEVTASVLDSLQFTSRAKRILLVDVATGASRTIAPTMNHEESVREDTSWWMAPSGQAMAVIRPGLRTFGSFSLRRMGTPRDVNLHWRDGRTVSLNRALPRAVLTETISWSPDGRELAFFAYDDAPINLAVLYGLDAAAVMPGYDENLSLDNPARLWRVNITDGRVESVETGDIDLGPLGAPQFLWTASGELVFHAPRRRAGTLTYNNVPRMGHGWTPIGPRPPLEWWVLNRGGHSRPLTTALKQLPENFRVVNGGRAFIGVSMGDVWRVDPDLGTAVNVTSRTELEVTAIIALDEAQERRRKAVAVLSARSAGSAQPEGYYILDLDTGQITRMARPASNTLLVAFSAASSSAVYMAKDRNGTLLWRQSPGQAAELILEANTFLRDIAKSETRALTFLSTAGRRLRAQLTLPHGYQPGRRYPLITWVYLSQQASYADTTSSPPNLIDAIGAAGYAQLHLQMPGNLPGLDLVQQNALSMLSSSVLPALDKAIESGVADPDRLFVIGASWGGWSVAGLLTQTNRFKAGVAEAGPYVDSNLFACGALPRGFLERYDVSPHEYALPQSYCKQYDRGDTPWWRGLREIQQNSPIAHADRIQTPLLLIHGDLDGVAIDNAEGLFSALVSMRKPARFVRYWGEGHVTATPANIRDKWQRVFAWFDDFGDIARDEKGQMIFEGGRVGSRKGAPALTPDAFARFGPAAPAPSIGTIQ